MDSSYQDTKRKQREELLAQKREVRKDPELRKQAARRPGLGTKRTGASQQNKQTTAKPQIPTTKESSPSQIETYLLLRKDSIHISEEAYRLYRETILSISA